MVLTSASTCSYEGGGEEGIPDCSISCVDSVRRALEFILSMSLTFAENFRNVTSLTRFNLLQSLYRIYLNHWSYLTFLISWPEIKWKFTSIIKSITDGVIFKEKPHITALPYSLYHEKHLGQRWMIIPFHFLPHTIVVYREIITIIQKEYLLILSFWDHLNPGWPPIKKKVYHVCITLASSTF